MGRARTEQRECTACHEVLTASTNAKASSFYVKRRAGQVIGWEGKCKECVIDRTRVYREAHRTEIYARIAKYQETYDRHTPERRAKRSAASRRYVLRQKALKPVIDRRVVVVREPVGMPG